MLLIEDWMVSQSNNGYGFFGSCSEHLFVCLLGEARYFDFDFWYREIGLLCELILRSSSYFLLLYFSVLELFFINLLCVFLFAFLEVGQGRVRSEWIALNQSLMDFLLSLTDRQAIGRKGERECGFAYNSWVLL